MDYILTAMKRIVAQGNPEEDLKEQSDDIKKRYREKAVLFLKEERKYLYRVKKLLEGYIDTVTDSADMSDEAKMEHENKARDWIEIINNLDRLASNVINLHLIDFFKYYKKRNILQEKLPEIFKIIEF